MSKPTEPEMEVLREIWFNDGSDCRIEVGPDRDGLGLIEIRYRDDDGTIGDRISMTPAVARLVARSLNHCANEIEHPSLAQSDPYDA